MIEKRDALSQMSSSTLQMSSLGSSAEQEEKVASAKECGPETESSAFRQPECRTIEEVHQQKGRFTSTEIEFYLRPVSSSSEDDSELSEVEYDVEEAEEPLATGPSTSGRTMTISLIKPKGAVESSDEENSAVNGTADDNPLQDSHLKIPVQALLTQSRKRKDVVQSEEMKLASGKKGIKRLKIANWKPKHRSTPPFNPCQKMVMNSRFMKWGAEDTLHHANRHIENHLTMLYEKREFGFGAYIGGKPSDAYLEHYSRDALISGVENLFKHCIDLVRHQKEPHKHLKPAEESGDEDAWDDMNFRPFDQEKEVQEEGNTKGTGKEDEHEGAAGN